MFEINDGFELVQFPGYVKELVRPAEFQRLGDIRQLGLVPFVFPHATHTRKSHSIGVAKNGMVILKNAAKYGFVPIDQERELPYVLAACLWHDLGQPPFSHTLQDTIEEYSKLSHEAASAQVVTGERTILEFYEKMPPGIIEEKARQAILRRLENIPLPSDVLKTLGIDQEIVAQSIDVQRSSRLGIPRAEVGLQQEITSSILDADRFDYLDRDARATGLGVGFGSNYLRQHFGIVEADGAKHLAIEEKGLENLVVFLNQRAMLHSKCYTHKTVLRAEAMLNEALAGTLRSLGDEAYKFTESLMLFTDDQLYSFMGAYSRDAVTHDLIATVKFDRNKLYRIAWTLKNGNDEKLCEKLKGSTEVIRDGIIARANAGGGNPLEQHEVIVHGRAARTAVNMERLLEKFNLYVFNRKSGEVYSIRDRLDGNNDQVQRAFDAYSRPINSHRMMVLTPEEHLSRVKKATEEYVG
jgi:HD superfamily phosphohydrolase